MMYLRTVTTTQMIQLTCRLVGAGEANVGTRYTNTYNEDAGIITWYYN